MKKKKQLLNEENLRKMLSDNKKYFTKQNWVISI